MNIRHHYENAPIAEAIIDLRVDPSECGGLKYLEELSQSHSSDYPTVAPIFSAQGAFQFGSEGESLASARQEKIGYRSTSADQRQICQWQRSGFTFSRLAPYESWEPFRDEAKSNWRHFVDMTKPKKVVRAAVRYINRLEIPELQFDLKKYLRTSPEVSPDLPQGIAGFFMQVRIPLADIEAIAVINQTQAEQPTPSSVSIILDIDIFRGFDEPIADDSLWEYFEKLHERKNEIFEACITDNTRSIIQ
jgi:uncharacterized protein (TIGR04255 family)